jgi:hypothetical protein
VSVAPAATGLHAWRLLSLDEWNALAAYNGKGYKLSEMGVQGQNDEAGDVFWTSAVDRFTYTFHPIAFISKDGYVGTFKTSAPYFSFPPDVRMSDAANRDGYWMLPSRSVPDAELATYKY